MPVLLGLCLLRGKLSAPGTDARKSIGSDGYWFKERAVVWFSVGNKVFSEVEIICNNYIP